MKIGFLSDFHGKLINNLKLLDIDIVLINGDFCKSNLARNNWINYTLKGKEIPKDKQKKAVDDAIKSAKKFLNSFDKPTYFIYGNVEKPERLNLPDSSPIPEPNNCIVRIWFSIGIFVSSD